MKRLEQEEAAARWVRAVLAPGTGTVEGAAGAPSAQRKAPAAPGEQAGETPPESWPAVWTALELPPSPVLPGGFSRRVARTWNAERARTGAPLLAAVWMRAAAAAALLAGIALGSSLASAADSGEATAASSDSWQTTSLSEEYLAALSTPDSTLEPSLDTSLDMSLGSPGANGEAAPGDAGSGTTEK